ncbi:MAG: hypothetical protein ACKVQA_26080 [Burkholderiales bacterium]
MGAANSAAEQARWLNTWVTRPTGALQPGAAAVNLDAASSCDIAIAAVVCNWVRVCLPLCFYWCHCDFLTLRSCLRKISLLHSAQAYSMMPAGTEAALRAPKSWTSTTYGEAHDLVQLFQRTSDRRDGVFVDIGSGTCELLPLSFFVVHAAADWLP